MMLVSIIIPLFNKEKSIKNTLNSIINQSYANLEVVIIDDGSTDNSANIVLSFDDKRIKYYRKENGGVSSARNKGIELAKGEWIMFLDADDTLYPNVLHKIMLAQSEFCESMIISGNYIIKTGNDLVIKHSSKDGIIHDPYKKLWKYEWDIRLGSFIVNRKILSNYRFDDKVTLGEDVLFVKSILVYPIYHINENIMIYNKEYSELSSKKVDISKTYSWNNNIITNNFYRTIFNLMDLLKSLILTLKRNDFKSFFLLFIKKGLLLLPIIIILAPIFYFKRQRSF